MHPRTAMKIMLIIPVLEAITFWLILRTPQKKTEDIDMPEIMIATIDCTKCPSTTAIDGKFKGIKAKLKSLPPLLTFIAPLVIVFIFEYTCVSGFVSITAINSKQRNYSTLSKSIRRNIFDVFLFFQFYSLKWYSYQIARSISPAAHNIVGS